MNSIYAANQTSQAVTAGGSPAIGSAVRKSGCAFRTTTTGVEAVCCGNVSIDAGVTVAPTAEGTVTLTLLRNGTAVPGATASAQAAAGAAVALSVSAIAKGRYCSYEDDAIFTLQVSAAGTVSNAYMKAMQL